MGEKIQEQLSNDEIHQTVDHIDAKGHPKDPDAKSVLKYRNVLAWILKTCVDDFKEMKVEDIYDAIEADPVNEQYACIEAIESGHTDLTTIRFDLRTTVAVHEEHPVILNVELQDDPRPRDSADRHYDLAARGMYYLARMFDMQLSKNAEYSKLSKCYSIWFVMTPGSLKSNFFDYRMHNFGDFAKGMENRADYLELIMVYADPSCEDTRDIYRLLQGLFVDSRELEQFIPRNSETKDMYKEVTGVCDIRKVGEAWGVEKGMLQGMKQGMQQGVKQGTEKGIGSLVITLDEINADRSTILSSLQKRFSLTPEEAEKKYNQYTIRR